MKGSRGRREVTGVVPFSQKEQEGRSAETAAQAEGGECLRKKYLGGKKVVRIGGRNIMKREK